VGAHQAHLTKTTLRSQPLVCVDCHGTKPAPGQFDHKNGVINIGFNALANTGLPNTTFNTSIFPTAFDAAWEATPTCANYCHGATLAGGSNTTPIWTGGSIQADCGSCHAVPLPYSAEGKWHVQNDACGACHPGYTSGSVVTATHIDGSPTRVNLTCATCHTPPVSQVPFAAPFRATTGATANTDLRVGAHARHLTTAITTAITCTDCHNQASSAPHANGAVNIAWGSRAGAAATPAGPTIPTGSAVTCANACHGQGLPAATGPNRTPGWSGTTLTGCTGCHRTPGEGEHRYRRFDTDGTSSNGPHASLPCTACHYAVNSSTTNTALTNPALHINGVRDVEINPGFLGVGGSATKTGNTWTCAVACHGGDPESAAGW
jgi:predicted CxxxxCH...CXXCH cytochrome family protein